jgi:hypothetical protein
MDNTTVGEEGPAVIAYLRYLLRSSVLELLPICTGYVLEFEKGVGTLYYSFLSI